MGRHAIMWHVWHWDGTGFELVYFDLLKADAYDIVRYNNERALDAGRAVHYVMAPDGQSPELA